MPYPHPPQLDRFEVLSKKDKGEDWGGVTLSRRLPSLPGAAAPGWAKGVGGGSPVRPPWDLPRDLPRCGERHRLRLGPRRAAARRLPTVLISSHLISRGTLHRGGGTSTLINPSLSSVSSTLCTGPKTVPAARPLYKGGSLALRSLGGVQYQGK